MSGRAPRLALLALALAALIGLVPTAVPSTSDARPDLAIAEFTLLGPVPGWSNGVPNSTRLQATVVNLGPVPAAYRIDYTWEDSTGSRPLNEDASASVDVGGPLAPGANATHPPVAWRLQPGQTGDGFVVAKVQAYAADTQGTQGTPAVDANPSNDARRIPLFVPVHRLAFSMAATPSEAPPDGAGFFRLTARNEGNVPEIIPLRLADPPQDSRLQPTLDPSVLVLPAGATSNATLFVDYTPAGDFSPFSLHYVIEAAPRVGAPFRVTTPPLTSGPENPDISAFHFQVSIHPESLQVPIGGEAFAWLTVTNDGSHADTYQIWFTTDPGWTVDAAGRTSGLLRIGLHEGEETRIPVKVRAPTNALPGTLSRIEAHTKASLLATPQSAPLQTQVPGAILSLDDLRSQASPLYTGDAPRILVTVANHGTQPSGQGAAVHLKATMPGLAPLAWQAPLGNLAPGATAVQTFELPPFANGGPLQLEASLHSAQGSAAHPRILHMVVHEPRLALQAAQNLTGSAGETVAYRINPHAFRVGNLGNAMERIAIDASTEIGEATIEGEPTLDLAPGEWRTISILHLLPRPLDGHAASNLTVTARIAERPESVWRTNATTFMLDQEAPQLRLEGTPPTVWILDRPMRINAVALDDDRVRIVQANVTAPSGTLAVVLLVPAGNDHWTAEIPLRTNGSHRIEVSAVDDAGHWSSLAFDVEGRNVPPPRLALEGPAKRITANGTAVLPTDQLRLLVEDEFGAVQALLEVRQTGPPTSRAIAIQDGVATFDLQDATAGPADIRLEVTNSAGATASLAFQVRVLGTTTVQASTSAEPAASRESPGPSGFPVTASLAVLAACVLRRRNPS